LRDAGVTMSSSNIIKLNRSEEEGFVCFNFQELTEKEDFEAASCEDGDNFVPILLGRCREQDAIRVGEDDSEADAAPVEAAEEEIIPGISEEEAARKVQAAFNEGVREGSRQAEESLSKVSEALAKALLSTGGLRQKVMQESEENLLTLAVMIARKIILQEISIDRRILVSIVKEAVSNVSDGDEVVVRLNPADYEIVADNKQFSPGANEKRRMTLKADENIPSGGCLVDTSMGAIDARIDAQIDEIFRRFTEERSFLIDSPEKTVIEDYRDVSQQD